MRRETARQTRGARLPGLAGRAPGPVRSGRIALRLGVAEAPGRISKSSPPATLFDPGGVALNSPSSILGARSPATEMAEGFVLRTLNPRQWRLDSYMM